jgi:two-component system cell cycle response regulator DivK
MLAAVEAAPAPLPDARARARRLVLVVDDCTDTRTLYSEYLDLAGFDVKEASDGIAALDAASSALPDVVVMDACLPGLDGREAARRLKSDPRTCAIPVVVVSGFAPPETSSDGGAPVWDAYVVKPCIPDHLVETIGRLLGAGEARPCRRGLVLRSAASGGGRPPW